MPRSRNLKPGFFTNDELAAIEPLGRLLFAGLWTIADRAGRLADRPKRIKAEVLPYDDCDVDDLLGQLAMRGFILRYQTADGDDAIQIIAWDRHQNPHVNEAASRIDQYKNGTSTLQAPCKNDAAPIHTSETHSSNREDSLYSDNLYSDLQTNDSSPQRPRAREAARRRGGEGHPDRGLDDGVAFDAAEQERVDTLEPRFAAIPGFAPTPRFWRTALDKYGDIDLDEEALKLAAWAADHPEKHVTVGTVLNWLKREAQAPPPRTRRRTPESSTNGSPRDPVAHLGGKYAALIQS